MKRPLTMWLEVGNPSPDECGDCPFRAPDYGLGEPRGWVCTCPAFEPHDVTDGKRHAACASAGEDADRLHRIAAIWNSWANGDWPEGAPSPRRTLLAIGELLGRPI